MSNDRDDFWDITKLLPKKTHIGHKFSTTVKTVDYTVGSDAVADAKNSANTRLTETSMREEGEKTVYEYKNAFIRSVTVTRFVDKYDFYGNFRKAALVYYDFKTAKCDFVPFYSYMPQYSQFNSEQKNFYFYWRDCVRRGKYIKTDYSYFYLYIYEILNLPDKIAPAAALETLVELWSAYRKELPNIDSNMSLWVQDYCIVYDLPCPADKIRPFIFDVIKAADFKEFYLSDVQAMGLGGVDAMLAYISDYDWKKGRYAEKNGFEIYSKHMLSAMSLLIDRLMTNGALMGKGEKTAHITKNAFKNSLCTHSVKCKLDIEYVPITATDNVRDCVTAAVRYTENKLRAAMGIKSCISVKNLPADYASVIDGYFTDVFNKLNAEYRNSCVPEYEKMYDAEKQELSFDNANEIERLSWTTTARLVEEYEDAEPCSEANEETVGVSANGKKPDSDFDVLETEFIKAVLNGDSDTLKSVSDKLKMLPDALADKINEAFYDRMGDVIFEGEYPDISVIEDYKEEVEIWLKSKK